MTRNSGPTETSAHPDLSHQLEEAAEALSKLPILGPATWLYARDPFRKHMFMADIDWALLPAIVLDQCRLFTKGKLPYAFVSWAFVSDAIDARLRSGIPKIAPHEWQSGPHVWLIDIVAPFGHGEEVVDELRRTLFAGKTVRAIRPSPGKAIAMHVHEWPPVNAN